MGKPKKKDGERYIEKRWKQRYEELLEYAATHGSCCVPHSHPNRKLYVWVQQQRHSYNNWKLSGMSKERYEALESIGFVWKLGNSTSFPSAVPGEKSLSKEKLWEHRYQELVKYVAEHGHANVPQRYKENPHLGRWVETQRRQMKLKNDGANYYSLSQQRIKALNKLGFVWTLRNAYEEKFLQRYQALKAFVKEHGHCRPKQSDNPVLHSWVNQQRYLYKAWQKQQQCKLEMQKLKNHEKTELEKSLKFKPADILTTMTTQRCKMLEELGMEWEVIRPKQEKEYYTLSRRVRAGEKDRRTVVPVVGITPETITTAIETAAKPDPHTFEDIDLL